MGLALARLPALQSAEPELRHDTRAITEQALAPRSRASGSTMFTLLPPGETGVRAENPYDDPRMWGSRFYPNDTGETGTGIAIGDYDNDGRPDIFVVSKTRSCRLFRNLGNWKFQDVTDAAGVGDKGEAAGEWKQGATFVDVNNDGRLDIFVCRYDAPCLLYINQGDGTFKEEAAARGLAVKDACVMAAFCDYDRDGSLDVFIQTNLLDPAVHPNGQRNYLFHNNGNGTFTDVTAKAGISGEAQGHSAIWWDYDGDGWPDLYVANDFAEPDKLYRNQRDGTFTNVIDEVVPHMPYSSMGSDLGDVNNDGLIDLFVSEMAPTTHEKDQRSVAVMRSRLSDLPDGSTQAPQMMRNALYLNTGVGRVLEAACLTGVAATDWTWSVRLEDLDNDGRLDLFVPNGMYRESHNADLAARKSVAANMAEKIRIERASPVLAERNLAFRNLGDLRFENVSAKWGLDDLGVTFGAAFGDLDGDGDLDLVYSNYERGVTVVRNDSPDGHRLIIALRGTRSNRFGVGANVRIETDSGVQVRELVLARGLLSSSEPVVHFGLGADTHVKRLTVTWPSGVVQTWVDLSGDRKLTITEPADAPATVPPPERPLPAQLTEVAESAGIAVRSREPAVDESVQQPLLPLRQNRRGPPLAIGDLNGDGHDDLVIGATTGDPARIFFATGPARFTAGDAAFLAAETPMDDGPILLFDADGDGAIDLLRTRAGVNQPAGAPDYQPKLYLNDGKGGFRAAPEGTLPALSISAGAAVAADFDRDGHLDLFIGGRVVPGQYPSAPQSALLANRGGRFEDVTDALAPGLKHVGMVTSALWSDVDGDGWLDLLVTLEWGQVKYFHNLEGKRFEDWTERAGFAAAGWWTAIAAADFNDDGRMDYVVGNVGLNTPYAATPEHPALLFSGDFADEGYPELVEGYYEGDRLYPRRTRSELGAAIPSVLRRFHTNDAYAKATLAEILSNERLAKADRYAATELRSGVFLSQPNGTFRFEALPRLAQISPMQGLVVGDFDGDGQADICAVQNSFAPIPSVGRFDGGLGVMLRGDGRGGFTVVPPATSGLVVPGDAKALGTIDLGWNRWPGFIATRNNATVMAFQNGGIAGRQSLRVVLHGPKGNPTGIGSRIRVEYTDGSSQTAEVSAGSGYWSQSTASCFFGSAPTRRPDKVSVRWPSGVMTTGHPSPDAAQLEMADPSL